jgi:hypothetical protein
MQSIPGQRFYTYRPSARSRVTAIVLSLAICAGITIMLIWMGIIAPNTNQPRAKLEAVINSIAVSGPDGVPETPSRQKAVDFVSKAANLGPPLFNSIR